jgi:AcrR family transcriptional regulator
MAADNTRSGRKKSAAGAEKRSENGTRNGPRSARAESTRERIINAAMELFAQQGYRGTTVGEIEERAGLAPRSGALYQHFENKEAVLRAGIDRHIDDVRAIESAIDMMPLGNLRSEIVLLGRWTLNDLRKREPLQRFVRKEGDLFPELLDRIREAVHDEPHRRLAAWIRRTAIQVGKPEPDCETLALIIAGSLSHYHTLESLYGKDPLDIDDERFLKTWVEACLAIAKGYGLDVPESES